MWKKKQVLWVMDEGEKPADKIAGRPHWITILLGAFSPLLGILAMIISLHSLWISERSLKVGNRAYLALLNGGLQFSNHGVVFKEGDNTRGRLIVRMDLSAAIHNAGNSPASPGPFRRKYRLPEGWSEAPDWLKKNLGGSSIGIVGPRSTVDWRYTDLFELTPEVYRAFRDLPGQYVVYMDAEFDYDDVFGETSTVRWCWAAATNEKGTASTDCVRSQLFSSSLR
jgi:hypothetical protein